MNLRPRARVPQRARVLKENLERYVDGMGHSELKVGWAYSSKDRTPEQNVTFLTQKLEESWELIKEKLESTEGMKMVISAAVHRLIPRTVPHVY